MQVVLGGVITNYEIFENKRSKDFLVILPGWMRTSTEWLTIAETFKDTHTVVIIDFPGFGLTSKPIVDWDTYDYARFTEDFLKKLGIHNCTLLGHSFGGRVAVVLASTTDIVEKLILVDSAGLKTTSGIADIKKLAVSMVRPLKRFLPEKTQLRLRFLIGSNDYANAGEMRGTLAKVVRQTMDHLLKKISVPTLIVWGDKDDQVSITQTKILKKGIPHSLVRIVWGSGHSPHTEKPAKFVEIVKEFLC